MTGLQWAKNTGLKLQSKLCEVHWQVSLASPLTCKALVKPAGQASTMNVCTAACRWTKTSRAYCRVKYVLCAKVYPSSPGEEGSVQGGPSSPIPHLPLIFHSQMMMCTIMIY